MKIRKRNPKIIKATPADLAHFAYRRDILTLEHLSKQLGRIDQLTAKLRIKKPTASPEEFVKRIYEIRAAALKRIRNYKKKHQQGKGSLAKTNRMTPKGLAAVFRYFAQFAQAQQVAGTAYRKVLGQNGICEIVHGIVQLPSQFHVFERTKKNDPASDISFVKDESFTDVENALIVKGEVFDADGFLIDSGEFGGCHLIHQYDLPVPTCDSFVRCYVNFGVSLNDESLGAEDGGTIWVTPTFVASPSGSIPAQIDFDLAEAEFSHLQVGRDQDGSRWSPERAYELTHSASFEVSAGVTSKIFFGVSVGIFLKHGLISGTGTAWLTHPPGATLSNPSMSPPFWPPVPGVQYLMWPKSMVPNCYITTAICSSLGKRDDCYELNLLRRYRDTYVASLPNGAALTAEYYAQAPRILAGILAKPDRNERLRALYSRFLLPCIRDIEAGRHGTALATYKQMVEFADSCIDTVAVVS